MYLALAAWGLEVAVDVALGGRRLRTLFPLWRRDPLALAAGLWAVTVIVCACAAPDDRPACLKFALRTLSGVLVFFAVRAKGRSPEVARYVSFALIGGAVVAALTALGESWSPWVSEALAELRHGSFDAFGLHRSSGVFAYPTIAAMYWEAVLPLVVVAPLVFPAQDVTKARRAVLGSTICLVLLFGAILASATRSSLVGGAVACGALAVVGRGWDAPLPRAGARALLVLGVTSAIALASPGAGSLLGQRLEFWHDDAWYGVTYEVHGVPEAVKRGELFRTRVTLRNTGTIAWRREGDQPTRLSYRWYTVASGVARLPLAPEGRRTTLPVDVPPGGVVEVVAVARAPLADGSYLLDWDLVQEDVTWFSDRGCKTPEARVVVAGAADADVASYPSESPRSAALPPPPSRSALWHAAVVLFAEHPLFGVGPDNFRRRYEAVLSPAPTGEPYADTRVHANSLYFETLADLGLLGVVALAVLMVAWVRALGVAAAERNVLGLGFGVASGTFFVHGLSDYFLEFTPVFALFWMLLGLLAAHGQRHAEAPVPRDSTS
jgi:hypothetical protein